MNRRTSRASRSPSTVDAARFELEGDALSYKAGTATECITPDEPLWLAGYASRTAPACGKISDLYASALALEDESGQRFVIASTDTIAITPIIADAVAETVRARHGLAREQLLLAATHTHYGPEFRPDKQVFFDIPAEYAVKLPAVAVKLAAALTRAIDQALARLEPVRLFVGKTSVEFAHNRRRVRAANRAAQRLLRLGEPTDEDLIDHDVPLLDCVNAVGNRQAVVFGYACHNTTIPSDDRRYCADWAGFAKAKLQESNPGATAFFLPGAGADQDPDPSGSVELSRQHGKAIADVVEQSLRTPRAEISGPIRVAWENVELALEPVQVDALRRMLECDDPPGRVKAQFLLNRLERGETLITSYSAPVQVVQFGNEVILVALSGEPVVDWAKKFRRELADADSGRPTPLVWVAGYCNDMFGYLPTRRVQMEGGYEGGRANLWSWIPAPFAADVEDRITDSVRRLVERVSR